MISLPRLDRLRASDTVFDVLRISILKCVFRPGERLDVKAIAGQLGVSLTPVKDAITRLAAEGLIDIRPRSGTFVTDILPETVAEIFEIRRALECLAAESLISRLTPELLRRFGRLIRDLERDVDSEISCAEHERASVALHSLIVEASGNRRLAEIYSSLHAHVTIARILSRRCSDANRLEVERREHRAILGGLETRDVTKLAQALNDHLRRAGQALVEDIVRARTQQVKRR